MKGDENLNVTTRLALMFIDNIREMLVDGRISSEDIEAFMTRIHPSVNSEYFCAKDYCNYDEACKILNLGYNRNTLNKLCKKYGIVNVKVKNRPLGFKRSEIERLREIIGKKQ